MSALTAGTAIALATLTAASKAEAPTPVALTVAMQENCDRLAGSPFDQNRNSAFAPVDIEQIDPQAVDACRVAFDTTGNPRFAFQLGRALNKVQQPEQAMSAYETAVQHNYSAAKVNFGMLLGRLGDAQAEFKMYSEAAQTGNVLAAYNLGVAYRDGLGTDVDGKKAIEWFEKAAAGGDDTAAFNLGVMYDDGQLIPEDNQMAIAWYDVAAKRGNADAMINLGLMYESGEGIKANPTEAANLFAQAAAQGDQFAALKLRDLSQAGVAPAPAGDEASQGFVTLELRDGDMEQAIFAGDI
ncbi:tetratricopeptide repeat protein [Rhizobium oryzicola]|uniref:Tetratricopeptide repeat protein n=1 Tax=Rhizobium oryzicola TaxID=1232668 RepID=A0ABT8SR07_9HYPH|nr:tetratricopeptide repeat protein [Rhizobium oryzicola]MDO1580871.1 tetratricopeptide repeat protein [Rhizobium oryzicola]